MSIATLKRKTQAKYNNSSVGQRQFSLNGTHRSQGYVGQTMLSRSLPRSLMNGNVLRGHGGCCGFYPVKPIVQSGLNYQEDSRVVKSTVMNTAGMIVNKYSCIGECVQGTVCDGSQKRIEIVKPDNNNNNNTQEWYIKKRANDAVKCNSTVKPVPLKYTSYINDAGLKCTTSCTITKTDKQCGIPMTAGEYTVYLNNGCTLNDIAPPTVGNNSRKGMPFAC